MRLPAAPARSPASPPAGWSRLRTAHRATSIRPSGWACTLTKTLTSAKRSSAEVIIEAPCCTGSGGVLPLANFGTVNFPNSDANGSPIGNSNPTEIIMQSGTTQKDSISALSGGTNFSATWLHK
jgi:hypothetical protein